MTTIPLDVTVTEGTGTFAIIEVAHPALRDVRPICPDCLALAGAAVGHAAATGSVGATYTVNKLDSTEVDHSITVRRQLGTVQL